MSLTIRQRDVLREILRGQCNKEIARNLGLCLGTVKYHCNQIHSRLGVRSREQLITRYMTPTEEARRLIG